MTRNNLLHFIAYAVWIFFHGSSIASDESLYHRKLVEDFDGSTFSPSSGLYYRENTEQAAGSAHFQSEVRRTGTGSLRLTVRPTCENVLGCSERAEIWERTELRVPYEVGVWYGFAVRFSHPLPNDSQRYLIAQWKREIGPTAQGDFSPFLGFRYLDGNLFVTVETNYDASGNTAPIAGVCPEGTTPVWLRPETNQMRAIAVAPLQWNSLSKHLYQKCTSKIAVIRRGANLPKPVSGWMHFAVFSKPGPDGSGHIEIFANGDWVVTVKGAIGHSDIGLGSNQYFKFGPYRNGTTENWALYYDDFVRSSKCEDVLQDIAKCLLVDASVSLDSSSSDHKVIDP